MSYTERGLKKGWIFFLSKFLPKHPPHTSIHWESSIIQFLKHFPKSASIQSQVGKASIGIKLEFGLQRTMSSRFLKVEKKKSHQIAATTDNI